MRRVSPLTAGAIAVWAVALLFAGFVWFVTRDGRSAAGAGPASSGVLAGASVTPSPASSPTGGAPDGATAANVTGKTPTPTPAPTPTATPTPTPTPTPARPGVEPLEGDGIVQDTRDSFVHGPKPAANQKYIVLHDTEGTGDPASVIAWWDASGNLVASHFVIGVDGTVHQAVGLDTIAHHAGYGDAGHNDLFGVTEDGRDDMAGSVPIGDWAPDYGMNAWSVGIELVHVGGSGSYPEAQLVALDRLIAHIDAYFGFESAIIDHKAWRSGNSDMSAEFAGYLANYQDHRTHE